MQTKNMLNLVLAFALIALLPRPAAGLDEAHRAVAEEAIANGVAYLRETQNDDGSWHAADGVDIGPAITGLCVAALLDQPDIDADDPAVASAIAYILAHAQDDGSIRQGPEGILASYNTSICLSALSHIPNNEAVDQAIAKGQDFLRNLQWQLGMTDPNGETITRSHPFFGGFGYGKHGRPDLSNTQIALQAMHDTGCDCDDPSFQRALTFLNRVQNTGDNELYADQLALDGGFIYASSVNSDNINTPQSMANPDQIDEGRNGNSVSGLRSYGGMTYAGFKSMLYAGLNPDDPRVLAVIGWIGKNYRFDQNPGMPEDVKLQGLYYYYLSMARAMNAYGHDTIEVQMTLLIDRADADLPEDQIQGETYTGGEIPAGMRLYTRTTERDWANDLIDALAEHQHANGAWENTASRWMEDSPVLCTAYAVLALNNTLD